ncbi:MAG: hypothetical protein G01um101431_1065 [Parcubacteria group bacterium Gr01-1014_31]|nr:MAG: hypothetical protein G01um101431_1065 [Parcubacteria group bacterium Gr01-1014_31]
MPPHCDTWDGPVIKAAKRAVAENNVAILLPYAPAEAEAELRAAFMKTMAARALGEAAREVAEQWLYETVVRLHRAGEGAPFSGLQPAGLSVGPVIPLAERAIETGDPQPLVDFLTAAVQEQLWNRFHHLEHLQEHAEKSTVEARQYTQAMLGFQVYSHQLYTCATDSVHGHGEGGGHRH